VKNKGGGMKMNNGSLLGERESKPSMEHDTKRKLNNQNGLIATSRAQMDHERQGREEGKERKTHYKKAKFVGSQRKLVIEMKSILLGPVFLSLSRLLFSFSFPSSSHHSLVVEKINFKVPRLRVHVIRGGPHHDRRHGPSG